MTYIGNILPDSTMLQPGITQCNIVRTPDHKVYKLLNKMITRLIFSHRIFWIYSCYDGLHRNFKKTNRL